MPFQALTVRPGINTEATPLLNESGWSTCNLIRFFQGLVQKLGGWTRLISQPVMGTARALVFFEDKDQNQYIGIGTEKVLEVYVNGSLTDITPVIATSNISGPFTTASSSTSIVEITDVVNGGSASVGSVIQILNSVSVGNVVLRGSYTITNIIDGTHYEFDAGVVIGATVSGAGTAAEFTTTNTSSSVQVTLDNHGLSPNFTFTVNVSTTVGGVTLFGEYNVDTVIDADNFTITASASATSSTNAFENSGDIRIVYELSAGNSSASNVSGLYGVGPYGSGLYGSGTIGAPIQPRLWSLGAWGTDMVASYTNGPIYFWQSENGLVGNPATLITQAPQNINAGIFIAMPQQQIVALGASVGSEDTTNQLLVRWCDVDDFTDWTASATNQAGSFPIPRGAHIAGGLQGPQQGLIWTDIGLWAMQYVGFPLVYGFNELGEGCGLIGQNAKGVLGSKVYWMSQNNFFVYDGNSVQILPCSVWDIVFKNLNLAQVQKIIAAPNSFFNEISFFFPSNTGDGEIDSYVKFNAGLGVWDYGSLVRTAWLDQTSLPYPVGVDESALLQRHEFGNDADGVAMDSFAQTGWFKISEGTDYTFIERLIPDFIYDNNATLQITMQFQDYPNAPITSIGPLTATEATRYLIVRGRGRLANIKFQSTDLGSFWRQGQTLYSGAKAGRR